MPCRDEAGNDIGKTAICCHGFAQPMIVPLPYDQVRTILLPQ